MTLDEIREMARGIMARALEELKTTESVEACFYLITSAYGIEVHVLVGESVNDAGFKTRVSQMIRQRVQRGDIVGVIYVADTFWSKVKPDAYRAIRALKLGVEEAAAMGLCTKHEGVLMTLESPLTQETITQEYRRIEKTIELIGEPILRSGGKFGGRFFGWFEKPKTEVRQ
jgi:hypothetical protein